MALTVRSNGSGSSNIIQASWWNDYYNLLTGQMADQEVTIKNVLSLIPVGSAPAASPTLALAAGTSLSVGLYGYAYSFLAAGGDGESTLSPSATVTTTSGNQNVNLSNIATGPTGTTGRRIYRSKVGGGTPYSLLTTINDNTTTTYSDTTPDASLPGPGVNTVSTFGGSLAIKDTSNNIRFRIGNDGTLFPTLPNVQVNGSTNGYCQFFSPIWGFGLKIFVVLFVGFNSTTNAAYTFPNSQMMSRGVFFVGSLGGTNGSITWQNGTSNVNFGVVTGLSAGGGSVTTQAFARQHSWGTISSSITGMTVTATSGQVADGAAVFIGN